MGCFFGPLKPALCGDDRGATGINAGICADIQAFAHTGTIMYLFTYFSCIYTDVYLYIHIHSMYVCTYVCMYVCTYVHI